MLYRREVCCFDLISWCLVSDGVCAECTSKLRLQTGGKGLGIICWGKGGGGQGEIKSDTKLENHDDDDHQRLDTKGMQKRQHCIPRTVSSMQKGHSMSSSSNSLLCMLLNDHAMSDR